jgi:proteasome lid subunit RPN8/RPN11
MLRFRATDYDQVCRHAEQTYPQECCGILLGEVVEGECCVRSVVSCRNARVDSPHSHYEIDPADLVRIQREARNGGLEIVGFYHSHPDHPAQWSQTDFDQAHWIGCSYVITSVEQGEATATRSFVLSGTTEDDKGFVDEEIIVDEAESWQLKADS